MARTPSTSTSAPRNSTPIPAEPGTLVRLRAAAAAVGVDEQELKRRAAVAGVKMHTVVRAGEAQAALDLDDVWRLRTDSAPLEAVDEHPSGLEVSRLASRLEKESEEHRARHAEELEHSRKLEESVRVGELALRVEKSRQAELESQLSESARTLAETQRAMTELRTAQTAREREFKTSLEEERKATAGAKQAIEAAKFQAQSATGAREQAEKRLEAAAISLAELKQQLDATRHEKEKLAAEMGEVKALKKQLAELEWAIVQLNATVAREQSEAKGARELAAAKEAEALRLDKECQRLEALEKRLSEERVQLEQRATAVKEEHAAELVRREAARVEHDSELQAQLKEAQALASKSEIARAGFEKECLRLAALEKQLTEEQAQAKRSTAAAKEEHAQEIARREKAQVKLKSELELQLQEARSAASKADATRAIFERELGSARVEMDKLEESCARSTLERDRLKQRAEALTSQLATAIEGERAIQRYADRKEKELAALRAQAGKG